MQARGLAWVLCVAILARLAFLAWLGDFRPAFDAEQWRLIGGMFKRGEDPYRLTDLLSYWPPFWAGVLLGLQRLATALGVDLLPVLRAFLITVEAAAAAVAYRIVLQLYPDRNPTALFLAGWSLNPIAILVVCQHANFDILMTLWILLAVHETIGFAASDPPQELRWLSACLFLGLGILTKTVPLVLAFVLCHRVSAVSVRGKLLGAALLVGPVATALGVARVLGPVGLVHKILGYRSFGGWFGITGLLAAAGAAEWAEWYAKLFGYALPAALGLLCLWVARHKLDVRQLALLAALAIFAVPLLGPGYASQYAAWYLLPLLPVFFNDGYAWRAALIVFYAVASLTYLVEYGLIPSHGALLLQWLQEPAHARWSAAVSTPGGATLLRLPLFLAMLAVFGSGLMLATRLSARPGVRE